jgi:cell division protein FtsW (lipid II flippase)
MTDRRLWGQLDARLIILTVVLMVIGIFNLYSATINIPGEEGAFYQRQLCWFLIGIVLAFVAFVVDYRYYEEFAYPFYLAVLVILIGVLVYGLVAGGGQRWIRIGFFYLQPSELMKIALILALARYFAQHERKEGYRLRDLRADPQAARFGDGYGCGTHLLLHCPVRQDPFSFPSHYRYGRHARHPLLVGWTQGVSAQQDSHLY